MTTPREITRIAVPTTVAKLVAIIAAVDASPGATIRHRDGTLRVEEQPAGLAEAVAAHEDTTPAEDAQGNDVEEPTS